MSKQFHSFRAPIAPRSPPSTLTHFRKAYLRLSRDLLLKIRSASRTRILIVVTLFLLFILSIPFFRTSHPPNVHAIAPSATQCACPLAGTAERFSRTVLGHANFVARVKLTGRERGAVVGRIEELFRGPLRSVEYDVLGLENNTSGCFQGVMGKNWGGEKGEWLVVAGGVLKGGNRSVLKEGKIGGGMACARGTGMVWMTPWELLEGELVEEIRSEGGEGDMWWRMKDASLEFEAAVRRAEVGGEESRVSAVKEEGEPRVIEGEWWLREGVSIVAACKDRGGTLGKAMGSWMAVRGVDEVVLVDWSSEPSIKEELSEGVLGFERVRLVRVEGQTDWVLSRAYNLGVRLAKFDRVMKVDCDTFLDHDFFEAHMLQKGTFYAGDWRQLDSGVEDALHVNGLLYAYRDDFLAVGGYDERITTYGWDDSDIAERLSKMKKFVRIDYTKVRHIAHPALLRVVNQRTTSLLPPENPHAAAVEIQRNRLLLTRFNIPEWKASSLHTQWNVVADHRHRAHDGKGPGRVFTVTAANEITAASSLVSDADALDVAKRAVRLILHRYGVQLLPKSLTLDFYKELITKVAFPERYAEVVLSLRGGCASRLLAYAASNQIATGSRLKDAASELTDRSYIWPPLPYRGWRLQGLWIYPDKECSCKFSNVFDAQEEEIISAWFDKANPLHRYVPISERQPSANVTNILKSFDVKAKNKVISGDLLKWTTKSAQHNKHAKSRILMEDLSCDLDPQVLTAHRRDLIRAQFGRLVPSKDVQESVVASLMKSEPMLLDSPVLSKDIWPMLVGATYSTKVTNLFTAPALSEMANRWGPAPLPDSQLVYRLDRRAASLTVAVRISEYGVRAPDQLTPSQSQQLNATVTTLSTRIGRLFIGCLIPASNYLEAYPELALALAGFMSCGSCV